MGAGVIRRRKPPSFPSPSSLGAPDRFTAWRSSQVQAFKNLLDDPGKGKRISLDIIPTGVGKSLLYMTLAFLESHARFLILTSTKALQDQLMNDFGTHPDVCDIRGIANYPCIALKPGGEHAQLERVTRIVFRQPPPTPLGCELGPCMGGMTCSLKDKGCLYFDRARQAKAARVVITNYAYWLSIQPGALGDFDYLILDEAHEAPSELSDHLRVRITDREADSHLKGRRPPMDLLEVRGWAKAGHSAILPDIEKIQAAATGGDDRKRLKTLKELSIRLQRVTQAGPDWVCWREEPDRWNPDASPATCYEPVWPKHHTEAKLFRNISRIALFSATATPKTLEFLGVDTKAPDVRVTEYPSPFPAERRPIIYAKPLMKELATRLTYKADDSVLRRWLEKIDGIIKTRLDRKGILHTVSYDRARLVMMNSQHRQHLLSHESRNTRQTVQAFRVSQAPKLLVSPSVTTGVDFPMDLCRYQIIGKIAFPTSTDPITKARTKDDPDYPHHLAMTHLVQAVGRGMRGEEDWCETIIIDDNWSWWGYKYRHLAPGWFWDAYQVREGLPNAMSIPNQ